MQLFIIAIFLLLDRVAQAQNLPFPIAPPLDLQSYAGECPGRGQVLNAAQGTITINCPNTTFASSITPAVPEALSSAPGWIVPASDGASENCSPKPRWS